MIITMAVGYYKYWTKIQNNKLLLYYEYDNILYNIIIYKI